MKKSIIFILLAFISMGVFGQDKGEKYLAPSISASFGRQYASYVYHHYNEYSASQPLNVSIDQSLEFGYFFADDWRFAVAMIVSYAGIPKSQEDDGWIFNHTLGVYVNPNFAYYVPLYSDKLFYTPEIGIAMGYEFDYVDSHTTYDHGWNYQGYYRGISVYANLLGLEYRVSKKFAIGAGVGSFRFTYMKDDSKTYTYKWWQFNFNNATISAMFYL